MVDLRKLIFAAVILAVILLSCAAVMKSRQTTKNKTVQTVHLQDRSASQQEPEPQVISADLEDDGKNNELNKSETDNEKRINVVEDDISDGIIEQDLPKLKINEEAIAKIKKNFENCGRIYSQNAFAQEKNLKTHLACQESPKWTNDCKDGIRYGNLCVKAVSYTKYRLESYGVDRAHNNEHQMITKACNDAGMRLPTNDEIKILKRYYRNLIDKYKTIDIIGCETEFYPQDSCIRNPQSHLFIDGRTGDYEMFDMKTHDLGGVLNTVICVKRTGSSGSYNIRKEEFPELPPLVCPKSNKPVAKISCHIPERGDKNLCIADRDIIVDYTYNGIFENALKLANNSEYYELIYEPLECQCRAIGMHLPTEKEMKTVNRVLADSTDAVYAHSTGFSYPGGLIIKFNVGYKLDRDFTLKLRCVKRLDEKE